MFAVEAKEPGFDSSERSEQYRGVMRRGEPRILRDVRKVSRLEGLQYEFRAGVEAGTTSYEGRPEGLHYEF
jgi:hypothetical protein